MKKDDFKLKWGEFMDGALLERWPRTQDDEPEEPAFLCTRSSTDFSDRLLVNMLQAYEIPSLCMERGNGNLGRVYLGISGYGVDVYVPKSLLNDAKLLCEEENNEEL